MNSLLEAKPERRQSFSLLLNKQEYKNLSSLSEQLGISKGATLRVAVRSLLNTSEVGKGTADTAADTELDPFWRFFRGGK